jgi:undecaprenyl-diphosphatase
VSYSLDQQLFFFFNADHGLPLLDKFWATVTNFDVWVPAMILAGILVAWRGGFRARAMLVCLLLSVGIMEGGMINPLKKMIGKQRPYHVLEDARIVRLSDAKPRFLAVAKPLRIEPGNPAGAPDIGKSFPSGHTSNMFCFATVLTAFYRWRGALFFLVATTVGLSRIATGSHWPSDVLFTAPLSIAVTMGLLAFYSWLWAKFAPRWLPTLATRHPNLIPAS